MLVENFLEMLVLNPHHHVAIHLDKTAIAVIGETGIARTLHQSFDGFVIEAEIKHGIHHPRHGNPGAGTHRQKKRVFRITEDTAGDLFDPPYHTIHLLP